MFAIVLQLCSCCHKSDLQEGTAAPSSTMLSASRRLTLQKDAFINLNRGEDHWITRAQSLAEKVYSAVRSKLYFS